MPTSIKKSISRRCNNGTLVQDASGIKRHLVAPPPRETVATHEGASEKSSPMEKFRRLEKLKDDLLFAEANRGLSDEELVTEAEALAEAAEFEADSETLDASLEESELPDEPPKKVVKKRKTTQKGKDHKTTQQGNDRKTTQRVEDGETTKQVESDQFHALNAAAQLQSLNTNARNTLSEYKK